MIKEYVDNMRTDTHQEIASCDYCDLPYKRARKSMGVKVEYQNGDWFKFCDSCIAEHDLDWLIAYMYKRSWQ